MKVVTNSTEIKLTAKQELFCQKYVEFGNESEAYRQVYNASKMLDKSINEKACVLRKSVKVSARIADLQKDAKKRNDVTIDRIIQELKLISFFDPKELYNNDGSMKEIKDMTEEVRRAIAEIKVEELIINAKVSKKKTSVKMYSKLDSIEKFAKHLGFYLKDNEQRGRSAAELFADLMQQASK